MSNAFIRMLATDPAHPGDRLRIMKSEGCDVAGLIAETVRESQVDKADAEVIAIRECMALGPVERRWLIRALAEMDRVDEDPRSLFGRIGAQVRAFEEGYHATSEELLDGLQHVIDNERASRAGKRAANG